MKRLTLFLLLLLLPSLVVAQRADSYARCVNLSNDNGVTVACLCTDPSDKDRIFHDTDCDRTKDVGEEYLDASGAGGDSISIDSVAVVDPDFQDGGDINFTDTSNVVTATVKTDTIQTDEIDLSIAPAWTGDHDFGGGGIEIENNTAVPGSCTAGQLFLDTDATTGQQLYACEAGTFTLQGDGDSGGSTAIDALGDAGAGDDAVGLGEQEQTWTWDTGDTTAAAFDGLNLVFDFDPSTTDSGFQRLLFLQTPNNGIDADGNLDVFLDINNNDSDDAVLDAIRIRSVAGTITDAFDINDTEITNAFSTPNATITMAELELLDGGTRTDGAFCNYENSASENELTCDTAVTMRHEQGGLEAAVNAYNGLIRISSGTTSNITDLTGLNTALGSSIEDGATAFDDIADPDADVTIQMGTDAEYEHWWTWNSPATSVDTSFNGVSLFFEHDATTDAQSQTGFRVQRSNTVTGALAFENLIHVDNGDADGIVDNGIWITSGAGLMTDGIDATDPQITNAINIGSNLISHTGGTVSTTDLDIIDDGVIDEPDLDITNTPGAPEDGYALTWNQAGSNMTWEAAGGAEVNDLEGTAPTAILDDEMYMGSSGGAGAFIAMPTTGGSSSCHGAGEALQYNTSTNAWACLTGLGAGGTVDDITADTGGTTTGANISVLGGTNGIDTVRSTDTITLNMDLTEIDGAPVTWGDGTSSSWAWDVGATDPTLAFTSDTLTITNMATLTASGTDPTFKDLTAASVTVSPSATPGIDFEDSTNDDSDVDVSFDVADNVSNDSQLTIDVEIAGTMDTWFDLDGTTNAVTLGDVTNVSSITLSTSATGDAAVELSDGSINTDEILDNTVSATDLAATLTMGVTDILDFTAWENTDGNGLILPTAATSCANVATEGQICWEADADALWVGDGSAPPTAIAGGAPGADSIGTSELDDGADTPLTGEYIRVDTVDQAGIEYRTTSEVLSDIGAQATDPELDAIAALTETNDAVMFVAGGVWTADTTPAIVGTDFTGTGANFTAGAATALAGDPTDCGANTFATTIAASGNLTCEAVDGGAGGEITDNSIDANDIDETTAYTWTGDHDFSGGGIEIENGTTPPSCTEGQLYLDTDATPGQQLMACDAGTFVLQGDGTGGGLSLSGVTDTQMLYDNSDSLGGVSQMTYNGTNVTIDLISEDSAESTIQITEVWNDSGATIHQCAAVYISGSNAGPPVRPTIAVADSDTAAEMPALGLVQEDIANGAAGFVVTGGLIAGLDTSVTEVWVENAPLYVEADNTTTASDDCGETLTEVKPTTSGQLIQSVARVVRVNATLGQLIVQGAGRTNDLPVDITIGADDTINTDSVTLDNTWASAQLVSGVVLDSESPASADISGDFATGLTVDAGALTLAGADFANQGTTTTVLHGNAAGNPSWTQVGLTDTVTGTLPVGNGGTGLTSGTSGGILGYTATGTLASSALLTDGGIVLGGGAGGTPTSLGAATNGQIPIGDGTTDPVLATITGGNGIGVTNGAGTITVAAETHTECFTLFDVDDIAATNDIPSVWEAPAAVTVTMIACESDVAMTINLEKDDSCNTAAMSATSIESGDLICGTTMTDGTIDGANDNLADGDCVDLNVVSTTTAERVTICMEYTFD